MSLKYATERVYVIFTEWHILLSFSVYHLKKHTCTSNKKKYLSWFFWVSIGWNTFLITRALSWNLACLPSANSWWKYVLQKKEHKWPSNIWKDAQPYQLWMKYILKQHQNAIFQTDKKNKGLKYPVLVRVLENKFSYTLAVGV